MTNYVWSLILCIINGFRKSGIAEAIEKSREQTPFTQDEDPFTV